MKGCNNEVFNFYLKLKEWKNHLRWIKSLKRVKCTHGQYIFYNIILLWLVFLGSVDQQSKHSSLILGYLLAIWNKPTQQSSNENQQISGFFCMLIDLGWAIRFLKSILILAIKKLSPSKKIKLSPLKISNFTITLDAFPLNIFK